MRSLTDLCTSKLSTGDRALKTQNLLESYCRQSIKKLRTSFGLNTEDRALTTQNLIGSYIEDGAFKNSEPPRALMIMEMLMENP
jgi:hypothetical protein